MKEFLDNVTLAQDIANVCGEDYSLAVEPMINCCAFAEKGELQYPEFLFRFEFRVFAANGSASMWYEVLPQRYIMPGRESL